MPFSDASLAAFMVTDLGPSGAAFGLTAISPAITAEVAEVALLIGHPVADETDDLLIRACARWRAWTAAYGAATNDKDLKAGSADLKLSQRFAHIERRLMLAKTAWLTEAARVAAVAGGTSLFAFGLASGFRGR